MRAPGRDLRYFLKFERTNLFPSFFFSTDQVLCWRTVPVDNTCIGEVARKSEPLMRQVFLTWGNMAFTSPEDEQSFLEQVTRSDRSSRSTRSTRSPVDRLTGASQLDERQICRRSRARPRETV